MNQQLITSGMELVLDGITGKNWRKDPNFKETPERVARAFTEMLSGMENTGEQIDKVLEKTFPTHYSDMIFSSGIDTISMCPHHLLIVKYKITIAYVPSKGMNVIGASKLARMAEILSARPVLQEQLTHDIKTALSKRIEPLGVAVIVSGCHQCMQVRGVKQSEATFETSSMSGIFRSQPETRAEFFALLNNSKKDLL